METLTYAFDVSWDELDLGIDLLRNAGRPVSEVMTTDVVTVGPEDDLDTMLDLLADDERDINRLPVVDDEDRVVGLVARQDLLRALRDERRTTAGAEP
jgi:CBS domain-containing protein